MKAILSLRLLKSLFVLFLATFILSTSCNEKDPSPAKEPKPTPTENVYANRWILDNMEMWYLWETELPSSVDLALAPKDFFESLLVSQDRFSWFEPDYQKLLNALKGVTKESGYEFVLYREDNSTSGVIAQITYVKTGSPAFEAGLKRGDIIKQVNGNSMTESNYRTVLAGIREDHTLTYQPIDVENNTFLSARTTSLSAIEFAENPNHLNAVIDLGDKKVGYFVYTLFSGGASADSKAYDLEMDQIFANYKASGISELVLDLRFNTGGSETSATNLASLIAPNVTSSTVFARREYNDFINEEIRKDPDLGESFFNTMFKNKSENIGSLLSNNRVYVLTSDRTASASELVINGLKPFMEVILVGNKTYGKNVGSISLYKENDPKIPYGLQPIVVKIFNKEGKSDYGSGFTPDFVALDNSINLYPLGDTRERLLSLALNHIMTGAFAPGREDTRAQSIALDPIGNSFDIKGNRYELNIDVSTTPFSR